MNLDELQAVVWAAREREKRGNRFMASLKGINLDADENEVESNEERFAKAQARATATLEGRSQTQVEFEQFDIALDYEVEE